MVLRKVVLKVKQIVRIRWQKLHGLNIRSMIFGCSTSTGAGAGASGAGASRKYCCTIGEAKTN